MDLVLRLRELRRIRGLSQAAVARAAGIGVKTLSSFETGARIDSMKVSQLQRLLRVYAMSEAEFFSAAIETLDEPDVAPREVGDALIAAFTRLPAASRAAVLAHLRHTDTRATPTAATTTLERRQLMYARSATTPPTFKAGKDLEPRLLPTRRPS